MNRAPAVTPALVHAAPWRLSDCLPGWSPQAQAAPLIGALPGEGIGPEVVAAALRVLGAAMQGARERLEVRELAPVGGGADDAAERLSPAVEEFCDSIFAEGGVLFCGPIAGRATYDFRARFDLYCKVVPLRPSPALADAAILRPERLTGVDVLIVRENVGGLYFGDFGRRDGGAVAYQSFAYHRDQVARVAEIAARLAQARRGRLAAIVKEGGVPEVSALWREVVEPTAAAFGVHLEILEVDNAAFQLVAEPARFDVVVAPNLFGDVLADGAAVLLGSRGMSYSANFGAGGRAAYQTGHGAARDLAGADRANPVAQILSLAMMLRESFGLEREAGWIAAAVETVLAAGVRTSDIAGASRRIVGTRELGDRIAAEVSHLASGSAASG